MSEGRGERVRQKGRPKGEVASKTFQQVSSFGPRESGGRKLKRLKKERHQHRIPLWKGKKNDSNGGREKETKEGNYLYGTEIPSNLGTSYVKNAQKKEKSNRLEREKKRAFLV